MLTDEDRQRIELLIVASESGVDQEKPMSTWVHRYLGLSPHCRNFEIKHACYGGTAGLQMAASWIASGLAGQAKALLVTTDQSRMHLGQPWEYVLGAGAAAILISREPRIVQLEPGKSGYWTQEVSDLTRPTLTVEIGQQRNEPAVLHRGPRRRVRALPRAGSSGPRLRQLLPEARLPRALRRHDVSGAPGACSGMADPCRRRRSGSTSGRARWLP